MRLAGVVLSSPVSLNSVGGSMLQYEDNDVCVVYGDVFRSLLNVITVGSLKMYPRLSTSQLF